MNYLNEEATDWLQLFIGVVIVLCATAIGGVMGFEHRDRIARVEAMQPKPRPISTQLPPANLIPCGDPIKSRELVSQICRARYRSAQIGGGQ